MNPDLDRLHPYPFEKLAQLKAGVTGPAHLVPISLGIGEPKHPAPEFIKQVVADNLARLGNYPTTKGTDELREAISQWATKRFALAPGSLTAAHHIVPVNGTREGIFSLVKAAVARSKAAAAGTSEKMPSRVPFTGTMWWAAVSEPGASAKRFVAHWLMASRSSSVPFVVG